MAVPVPVPAVNVAWQLAVPRVPAVRLQGLPLKVPAAPVFVNVTVPVGVICVPGFVAGSVTVAVHVVAPLGEIVVGEQVTVVFVDRVFTAMLVVPLLVA